MPQRSRLTAAELGQVGCWACYCMPPTGCRGWPVTAAACPDCGRLQPPVNVTRLAARSRLAGDPLKGSPWLGQGPHRGSPRTSLENLGLQSEPEPATLPNDHTETEES